MMSLLTANRGRRARFELAAEPGSQVFVAGTFNRWNPTANPLKDNPERVRFKTAFHVPKGTQEYKFVVNGEWRVDPNCPESAPNDQGSVNSVISV